MLKKHKAQLAVERTSIQSDAIWAEDEVQFEPTEAGRKSLLAEDMARFRQDLASILMAAPLDEWSQEYHQYLLRYPHLMAHQKSINLVFQSAFYAAFTLDKFWGLHHDTDDKKDYGKHFKMEIASPVACELMYKTLFKTEPKSEMIVLKGRFSIWFLMGEQDILTALPGDHKVSGNKHDASAITRKHPEFYFPVVLFPKPADCDISQLSQSTIVHEAEHCTYQVLNFRHLLATVETESDEESEEEAQAERVNNHLIRLSKESLSAYSLVKNELLAYFTAFDLYDYTEDEDSPDRAERFIDSFKKYSDTTVEYLSHPGNYLFDSNQELPEQPELQKRVQEGWNALIELLKIYVTERTFPAAYCPARMTLNVLEQFPLQSWPAVVRLVKSHYKPQDSYSQVGNGQATME